MTKASADPNVTALAAAIRATADPASSPFAHMRGVKLGDPKFKALLDFANSVARADQIVAASEREQTTQATAQAILRAGKIARGEVVELPTDRAARAIIQAGRLRRGEEN